jgi:hypothetical protein
MMEPDDVPKAVPKVRELMGQAAIVIAGLIILPIMAMVLYEKQKALLLLLLAMGAGSIGFLMLHGRSGLKLIRLARELDRDGMITHGTVVDKLRARSKDEIHYDILYQYGDRHRAWQKVSPDVYDSLSTGDTVKVRCLLRDPKYSRMEFPPQN